MIDKQPHEIHRRRRGRNWGLGLSLAAFVVVIFAVTIVKLMDGQIIQAY